MKSLRIIVKPVDRPSVQGRHKKPVILNGIDTGQTTQNPRVSGTQPVYFQIDRQTGKYRTGLDELVTNTFYELPWIDTKAKQNLSDKWDALLPSIEKTEKISMQQLFEIMDGVDPGTYHSTVLNDMTNVQGKPVPKSFIEKFYATLYTDGANVFSSDTQRGRFCIQAVKNARDIAKDRFSINPNIHNWYIAEQDEQELDRTRMDKLVNRALFELETINQKFPAFTLYKFAIQLKNKAGVPLVKGEVSDTVVYDRINRYLKDTGKQQEDCVNIFLDLIKLFNEQPDKFEIGYLVQQAFNTGIIYTREGSVLWNSKINETNVYKWRNAEMLENFLISESQKDLKGLNYYVEFEDELKNKGIRTK